MSNPTTNFITYNQNTGEYEDLSGIFKPLTSGGTKAPITGFTISTGSDLNTIFDPSTNGIIITYNTGFTVNGIDLRYFFAAYKTELTTTSYSFTTQSGTNRSGTMFNNNYLPQGYNYFNFIIYGGGGNGTPTINRGGGGSGAFIKAINIPYKDNTSGTIITNITFLVAGGQTMTEGSNITIKYTNGSTILLTAGTGTPSYSTVGAPGGSTTVSSTANFYDVNNTSLVTRVNGNSGGSNGNNGTSNGYTSSGSGGNTSGYTAGFPPTVSNTFNFPDGNSFTVTSRGGGASSSSNYHVVTGSGAGGSCLYNTLPGDNEVNVIFAVGGNVIYYLS